MDVRWRLFERSSGQTCCELMLLAVCLRVLQAYCGHDLLGESFPGHGISLQKQFFQCFIWNGVPWFCLYSSVYCIFYVIFDEKLVKFKYDPKRKESTSLLLREIFFNFLSMIIVTTIETAIRQNIAMKCKVFDLSFGNQLTMIEMFTLLFQVFLLICWADTHFYWYHRLLHKNEWLFRNVHSLHHASINPNPFSGISFHPIESIMYFSSLLFVYWLPTPYLYFQIYKYGLLLIPCFGHLSYGNTYCDDISPLLKRVLVGPYEHWIHHQMIICNFGNFMIVNWDRIVGTEYKVAPRQYFTKRNQCINH